jgi:DNA topoisomerase VI subunit B
VTAQLLERRTFSVSRVADFLDVRALESQTGQPRARFTSVILKELIDNGLDAAETAGVAPGITVTIGGGDTPYVTAADNGPGIPPDVVTRILDYATLTSDKALYRSPARGAQGNALKTVLGVPQALGVNGPVSITARGVRHEITVGLDVAGNLKISHDQADVPGGAGTAVSVPLPAGTDPAGTARWWVRRYALVTRTPPSPWT